MRTRIKGLGLLLAVLFIATSFVNAGDLISAQELAKIMKDKNTVIVSCRKAVDYQKVHLPGAVNVPHMELYTEPASNGYIKPAAELAKYFGAKGISESKTIVLYDEGSGKYSGRVYWVLKYLGAKDVRILNGQMKGWRAARKPVTRAPAKAKPVTFTPAVKKNLLASTALVKAATASSGSVIIDARTPEEYKGTDESDIRKGHIPNAVNVNYELLAKEDATLKSKEELAKIFKAQGVTKDKEVIVYCKTSVRAGIVFFTLTDMLDYTNVKVYDKAFFGWQSASANKVVK